MGLNVVVGKWLVHLEKICEISVERVPEVFQVKISKLNTKIATLCLHGPGGLCQNFCRLKSIMGAEKAAAT